MGGPRFDGTPRLSGRTRGRKSNGWDPCGRGGRVSGRWVVRELAEALAASADCNGRWFWHYNLELPQGFWSDGVHTYQLRGAMDGVVVFTPPPVTFAVTPAAPMYRGQAQLRFYAVLVYQNGGFGAVGQLNSTQDTVIQVNDDLIGSKQQADAFSARETSEARWDGGPWVAMDEGPVLSFCSFDPA